MKIKPNPINEFNYDAVVILSQSNWFEEMRSNRYHYAMRFAAQAPVFFVQQYDSYNTDEFFIPLEKNLEIVNPTLGYSVLTLERILRKIKRNGGEKILFWIYSPDYAEVLPALTMQYTAIYHATEAYLGSDMFTNVLKFEKDEFLLKLRKTINLCSSVIAVSNGVAEGIINDSEIIVPVHIVTNGCDFNYWNGLENFDKREDIILYQGGIHKKLDFDLIKHIISDNKELVFIFCGEVYVKDEKDEAVWDSIKSMSNFKLMGKLHPDQVLALSHKAKVGIIPFKNEDWLKNKSFPLKAFEYLSAGLEVVSTPINALDSFKNEFKMTAEYQTFSQLIKDSITSFPTKFQGRKQLCENQDYGIKFNKVLEIISNLKIVVPISRNFKKNILIIYDRNSCHVSTLREHLDAFGLFSKHSTTFVNGTGSETTSQEFIDSFDAIVVHYSVRISVPGHLAVDFYSALKSYVGLKVLFIQDEYDNVKSTHKYIKGIDFDVLYTIINKDYCYKLYPADKFPYLKIIYILTGYVPYKLTGYSTAPIADRKIDVFYRGRELPYQYGSLGKEKYEIGKKFSAALDANNLLLNLDVNSDNSKRIYGDGWYKALSTSKTMLGTESGSNVFDLDGDLHDLINKDISDGLSYDEIFENRLNFSELEWHVNMISPKAFEAIMLGTVLVLYEGEYSGVLTPHRHYIPLKKDFSNILEVVDIINNNKKLAEIANTAYEEIACNPLYSYEYFTKNNFDKIIDENVLIIRRMNIIPDGSYYHNPGKRVKDPFLSQLITWSSGYLPSTTLSAEAEYLRDSQQDILQKKITLMPFIFTIGKKVCEIIPRPMKNSLLRVYNILKKSS